MKSENAQYSSAARFEVFTAIYDPAVAFTCREKTFKRALIAQAGLAQGQRVLDLGCGTCTLTLMILEAYPGLDMTGLDADERVLSIAAKKAAKRGIELQLDLGMSYDMPYEDASFDRVVSSYLFHHLTPENKRMTLAEVMRVLKPGGELHVADWGKPPNFPLRLAFFAVQLLDGFKTTSDSVRGMLPVYIEDAGYEGLETTRHIPTPLGSVFLYHASKPRTQA
ncbi:MAG: class I SAM-dependent methyltransferase [Actinobacteria bacterium]|nr:class I SAM-dependent methyltransferase [Actinomycetota bacterium]